MKEFTVKIKSLTPLWTGDADRKNTTLRETGIIGSLRWWYEALIRGLGGTACDPTDTKCEGKDHCDACELFGCTGWARKFRLEVKKINNETILQLIKLREVEDVEWGLLSKTLKIIASWGAIGGKIAEFKYGLIKIVQNDLERFSLGKAQLKKYLKKQGTSVENPNITRFVFINKDLNYETTKKTKDELHFLKGQLCKAKRYFYKTFNGKPYRFFAYAENDNEYNRMIGFLSKSGVQFVKGKEIIGELK